MRQEVHMRSTIRFTLALAVALLCSAPVHAVDEGAERFTFVVPDAPESTVDGDRFTLTLNRWSTDAERDRMLEIAEQRGTTDVRDAFRETGAIGYLRWPGGLEYSVRYAHRIQRPDGGSDVALVVERPVWVWWDAPAKTGAAAEGDARFTVVQLRLNANGQGEGRIATEKGIVSDKRLGVLVSDYDSRPAMLLDVRRERS
jgi:hypothetical protein